MVRVFHEESTKERADNGTQGEEVMSAKTLITKGGNIHFCQLVIGNLFQNIVSLLLFRFKVVMVTTFRNATLSGSLIAFTD